MEGSISFPPIAKSCGLPKSSSPSLRRAAGTMSTTLPLFWNLSSNSKNERIESSVKLVSALERFQAGFEPRESNESTSEDEDGHPQEKSKAGLDVLNAQDVSYSIRRLVRGLGSPRESSRLGFAVALTEVCDFLWEFNLTNPSIQLLSRINTVTCAQVTALILDSAKIQGSMTGQEERDILFARLFGLTAIIQSGLLVRNAPLASSGSSAPAAADANSCLEVVLQLLELGEKKSWLRESVWWSIGLAIESLGASSVPWKNAAMKSIFDTLFSHNKVWTPERVALVPRLQAFCPEADWNKVLSPTFKNSELLHPANYHTLARILKVKRVHLDALLCTNTCLGCRCRRRRYRLEDCFRFLESESSLPLGYFP